VILNSTFDVVSSDEDNQEVKQWIDKVTEEFKTVKDDTLYITEKSDPDKPYLEKWQTKDDLQDGLDTALFDAQVGTVFGPYKVGDTYKVSKLLGRKMSPDSVRARHILIKPQKQGDTADKLKAEADSLENLIKTGKAKFEDLAKQLSADQSSAVKGGDLGWSRENVMVKPFNDFCFNGKKGEMKVVTSQFGVHLVEITDVGPKVEKVNIGVIEREVIASNQTYQSYFTKADKFARENNTADAFENAVVEQGLNKRYGSSLKPNDNTIPGLESPRPLIKWAYEHEKRDVSEVFDIGDKFVVAVLTAVHEKGYAPLENVKQEVEAEVRKDKKAEKFIDQMNQALKTSNSVDALGTAINAPVGAAKGVTLASGVITGAGRELEVVGALSVLEPGKLSKPIKGRNGVYVVVVDNAVKAPEAKNYAMNKSKLENALKSRVEYEVYDALKEKANVVDNRSKFY